MSRIARIALRTLAATAVVALVAVPDASAGVNLFQASWIAEVRGNDLTTGVNSESKQFQVIALPLGRLCNPAHPACPFSQTGASRLGPTPLPARRWDPLGAYCVPNSAFGLGPTRPPKGATLTTGVGRLIPPLYRNPLLFQPGGTPKTTACSAAETISGGQAMATVLTTNDPQRGPMMRGAPLTGSAVASTAAGADPRAFTFPAAPMVPGAGPSGFRRTTLGSFSGQFPLLYLETTAKARNAAGDFGAGGGFFPVGGPVASRSFPVYDGQNAVAHVNVQAGSQRFGGVMRLLGQIIFSPRCYYRNGGCSIGGSNRRYEEIGAPGYRSAGSVTAPALFTYTAMNFQTNLNQVSTAHIYAHRFPWTTGTVTVSAPRGPQRSVMQRRGYDNRVNGIGTIQLVSPFVTQSRQPAATYETAGIAVMRLTFVPEPAALGSLAAGLGFLGALYRRRAR